MEERFSTYLTEIGILNETDTTSLMKKDDKASKDSNKSFADSSFQYLMNYFDNLDQEQKKHMSQYIPSHFLLISEKMQKSKLRSLIIQINLRKKIKILQFFQKWKNIPKILLEKEIQTDNLEQPKLSEDGRKSENRLESDNNTDLYTREMFNNITNQYLDNNENKNKEEVKDNRSSLCNSSMNNNNKSIEISDRRKSSNRKNSNRVEELSFSNINLKNNWENQKEFKEKIITSKNIKNKTKKRYNKSTKNKFQKTNKSINLKEKTKKIPINITSYKKSNKNNARKQSLYNSKNFNTKNSNKTHLLTSLEEKELKELKECTFIPKINHTKKRVNSSVSQSVNSSILEKKKNEPKNTTSKKGGAQLIFDKLYKDSEKIKLSREMKAIEFEHLMSRTIPFVPNLDKKLKKDKIIQRNISEGNFVERQIDYLQQKKVYYDELKNKFDSIYEEMCSFNPKITNLKGEYYPIPENSKNKNKTVFKRLYDDVKERKKFYEQKELENINKILNLSNMMNPGRNLAPDTINRLYEYKERGDIIRKTRKKVEEDEGSTFRPLISEDQYSKNVEGNFFERNRNFIIDRDNFYIRENQKNNEKIRNFSEKNKYSKEEKKQIINNIINRLYRENKNKKQAT